MNRHFSRIFMAVMLLIGCIGSSAVQADETKIWTNKDGLVSLPFCERRLSEPVVDPRMNPYLLNRFMLADGTQWEAFRENSQLVTVDCFVENRDKSFVVFQVDVPDGGEEIFVGVNAEEMSLFSSNQSLGIVESPSTGSKAAMDDIPAGVEVQKGGLDYVVCITGKSLNVRDESLAKVLFTVNRHTSAKPIQSFGTDRLKRTIDGIEYTFVKTEFPERATSLKAGWIAEKYLVSRKECPGAMPAPAVEQTTAQTWTFPTLLRPSLSYKEGMRRFKASRSKGRLHAACDLYRVTGEQALSISTGTVIRDKYYFYEGTYAIEIKHTGGKVARYGEITGKAAANIGLNRTVVAGQTVGYIGKVNSGCCMPMLHFELYAGTASGSLSQSGNPFQRRKDLIDPTKLLSEWEKAKFGISY